MSDDCIFCKIVKGELPCELVYDHELLMAFKDISPKAPVHVLVIPKKHIESLDHAWSEDMELLGRMTLLLPEIAKKVGLENGFRTILNTGPDGGQEVGHLHYHILGGGKLPGF